MLSTPFYHGQGLGNQLANYVTVRCLALDKGYDFGVMFPERFKGSSFMNLDMGVRVEPADIPVEGGEPRSLPEHLQAYYREAMIDNGKYDPKIFNLEDNTLVHGNLQGEDYFKHRREEIKEWLEIDESQIIDQGEFTDSMCVINFRGGEYKWVTDFFLPQSYWDEAIETMKKRGVTRFFVVTDDVDEAKKFFPHFQVTHDMAHDYYSILTAKNLILSNSSFGFLPAWLNDNAKLIIAPKFWGRRNKGYWFLEQNYTDRFKYI